MTPGSIVDFVSSAAARLVLVFVLALGAGAWGYHLGEQAMRADWESERAQLATRRADAERAAREQEARRADESRRVVDELAQREAVSRDRAARAERTADGLRDEIARLNARPAPRDPEAARFADEARAARELLGSCSAQYTGVAAQADQLRDQVTGLQDWVRSVVK